MAAIFNSRYKMSPYILLGFVLVPSIYCLHSARNPPLIECSNTKDCDDHQCCLLGANRYSRPRCVDLGLIGEPCRPYGNSQYNLTVNYPNNEKLNLTNVYFMLCDCAKDLLCDRRKGTCQHPIIFIDNDIA